MSKEELKPIDVSKYTVTESGNVIKSEEKETTKEGFFRQNFSEYCRGDTFLSPYWDLFETGYELKQNILSQHILELQADKGELTDRVKELEAQIEKMKCDLLELRSDSYDTGMYLGVDELIQKWGIKEK